MIEVTSAEAQNHFGRLLDTAQREPVVITRHGRIAAFLVSPGDMEELQNGTRDRRRAVEEFGTFFSRSDAKLTPAAKDLTDTEVVRLVHEER